MPYFARDYLRVLLPLLAMLAGYRVVAVPLLEPKHAQVESTAPLFAEQARSHWWSELFPADSWQRNQPKVLVTQQGILLFQNWDKLAPDRWKLHPISILIPQKETKGQTAKAGRRAYVINSPEGAEIQFREAIDWTSGKPPPVESGQLTGEIEIQSPESEPGANDQLHVRTRELRIDRRHIWTTQKIAMRLGKSYVEGRDLSIYLDQDLLSTSAGSETDDPSPFDGLDYLELIYVDRVQVDLPPGGLFAKAEQSVVSDAAKPAARAEVRCRGSFRFDFHASAATLSSMVELKHIVDGAMPDSFESDLLRLHFSWNKRNKLSNNEEVEWNLSRLEATGSTGLEVDDPTRWVRLEAPSINARGRGRWLRVDLDRGRTALANHLPGMNPNEPSQVYLQRDSLQVWAPAIEYESEQLQRSLMSGGDQVSMDDSPSLGQLWAAGPGQAAVVSEDGEAWKLSWAKSLQLQPEGMLNRLTIDGSANARSDRQGRIAAESVDVWLKRLPANVVSMVKSMTNGYEPSNIIPTRLHASGKVIVEFPQLRKQVEDLKLWFSYPEIELAEKAIDDPSLKMPGLNGQESELVATIQQPGGQGSRQDSQPESLSQATTPPASPLGTAFSSLASIAESTSQGAIAAQSLPLVPGMVTSPGRLASSQAFDSPQRQGLNDAPETSPLNVSGETLVAKVSHSSLGLVIEDLAITNNVTVMRDQLSMQSPLPFTIIGQQLRMDSKNQGKMDVTVLGNPAKIAVGSGGLESAEIRCDQAKQLVWMEQPGIFRIPPEAMTSLSQATNSSLPATISTNGINPSVPALIDNNSLRQSERGQLEWIEAPEISWQGRMVFDGRLVKMDGGVRITGCVKSQDSSLWFFDLRAKEMTVELESPIEILGESQKSAKVANIHLIGEVDAKAANTDLARQRRSLEHLQVPELKFDVLKQAIVGAGPGSLRSRRIGNANPASPKEVTTGIPTGPTNPITQNPQAELQCLHLVFQGQLEGDIAQQSVTFSDRVECLLQPILSWDDSPDIQLIDQVKLGQTTLFCDQLSVYNTSNLSWNRKTLDNQQLSRDAAWEVTGAGSVRVESLNESGSFSVLAHRAQYVALHSLLRVEGNSNEPALILRRASDDPPGSEPWRGVINNGAINMKTGEAELDIVSIRADLNRQPNRNPVPSSNAPLPNNLIPSTNSYPNPSIPQGYGIPSNNPPAIQSPRNAYPLQRMQ